MWTLRNKIYVILWLCDGICHQPDTFIRIGSGHTVNQVQDSYAVAIAKLFIKPLFDFWSDFTKLNSYYVDKCYWKL